MRRLAFAGAVGAVAAAAACDGEPLAPSRPPPEILTAMVSATAHQVLGAVVTVAALHADSAAVRVRPAGAAQPGEATPARPLGGGEARIPVLGLLPEHAYEMRVVAVGAGGTAAGEWIPFTTGALPPDLPRYAASGGDPTPGFVVFAAGPYGLVIDNGGRVVWYRRLASGPGLLNFMAQPNGRYVARAAFAPPGAGAGAVPWLELDVLGDVTRQLGCAGGLAPRFHDLVAEADGGWWLLCDETRTMDLAALGGHADARVTGTVVQHRSAAGELLFRWSPFDHFSLADLPPAQLAAPEVNWTHGNALDLAPDGDLLVSFRNLDEVTRIDVRTGAVRWRLGGARSDFALEGAGRPFGHQHSARAHGDGGVVVLDNTGDPLASSAERWLVDPAARVARLAQAYRSTPPVRTEIGGSVQLLPGGRMLVSFGTAGRVEEIDAGGAVRWRLEGEPGYVFRAQRIASLYEPGVGLGR